MESGEIPKPTEVDALLVDSQVVSPFCVSWSQDNKISVIVEDGVYVFELSPTPVFEHSTITLLKSWITSSMSVPLTTAVVDDKYGSFLWGLKRKEAFEMTLDSTLSCAVQKANTASHIIHCEFSPLICNRSYLSCLTNHGLLEVYQSDFKKWFPVLNITELWILYCQSKSPKDMDFSCFKQKMFQLKITTMKWFEKPEVILVTGHENGEVCLWNASKSNGKLKMSVRHCLQVGGKPCTFELHADSQKCLLFVGTLSGAVRCVSVDLVTEVTGQHFYLWKDEDLISPKLIIAKQVGKDVFVLTVKRQILLIQKLERSSNEFKVTKTNWEEFRTTIVSLEEYRDDFLVSLQNHEAYIFRIKEDVIGDMRAIDMAVKSKHRDSHHSHGLAMSPNKAIWLLVSSPAINYDSLKEITHLIFYTTEVKMFKSLTDFTSSGLIEKIVKHYKTIYMSEFFDLLELKKIELLSDGSKFKDSYDIKANSSSLELKLMLWEVKLRILYNSAEFESSLSSLEIAIARKRAKELVRKMSTASSLSDLEKKSLEVCLALSKTEEEQKEEEFGVCAICGGKAFSENVRTFSCSNSHKFPRCCLSFLPCDVVPYAVCRNCDAVALNSFVTDSDCRCPFCDGLLMSDTKLR